MVRSIRGKEVDMQALANSNADMIALGNAKMNARGDLLGKNGKVLKSREELAQEYHKTNPNAVKNVPLSSDLDKMVPNQKKKVKADTVETKLETKTAKSEVKKSVKTKVFKEEVNEPSKIDVDSE